MAERDLRLDSIKGFLIILVILGHIIGACGTGVICEDVWQIIYVFHMPLFILISGFLTSIKKDNKSFWQSLIRILVPLLIFQILFVLIAVVVFRNAFAWTYLYTPYWTLWYLLSLVFWRIIIQYTPKKFLEKPYLYMAIATIIAVFCGLMPNGRIMSIQRTFNFFPFFLFGYYLNQGAFKARLWPNYVSYWIVVVVIVLIVNEFPPPLLGMMVQG